MREAVATSRTIGSPGKLALELTALGHLLVAQGNASAAVEALEEALAILEPGGQWVTLAPCFTGLARARALLGDDDGAAALFARAHALWQSTQDRGTVVLVLLEGCLFHAARGDARRAMEWADDLGCVAGDDPVPVAAAAAAHARGAALTAQGSHVAALGTLSDAVQRWEELSRPYDAARARAALGAALLATSPRDQARRAEADAALVAAEETFRRLGAAHDVTHVEGVRRRGGLLAQARRRQSLSQGRAPFGDLTPREREVLRLLVEGHTNREIAQALFIAEGTAELHVSRILGKLGCATRAQAAAYAVAHGLVGAR
jgi:DNA-binding CsgD family transcriptional regulator